MYGVQMVYFINKLLELNRSVIDLAVSANHLSICVNLSLIMLIPLFFIIEKNSNISYFLDIPENQTYQYDICNVQTFSCIQASS